jgi:hypothetical protein
MLAYAWSEIAGYSKFGSYTGNGSTDGTFVYLGFRPKFLMFKRTDAIGDWLIFDTSRSLYNTTDLNLNANGAPAEQFDGAGGSSAGFYIDLLSNGFKQRSTGIYRNASGGTYIYMAFAESPFRNSLAR